MSNIVAAAAAVVGYFVVGNVAAYAGQAVGRALGDSDDEKIINGFYGSVIGGVTGSVGGAVAGWKIAKAFMEE